MAKNPVRRTTRPRTCYDTDVPTGLPSFKPPANVWVNDEFQAFKPMLDGHVWELCVPGTSKAPIIFLGTRAGVRAVTPPTRASEG